MRISVVIPYMEAFPEKRDILRRCTQSLKGHDEVVVISNWKEGYAKPINKGLAVATGDYMIVMNDDIFMTRGNLKDLCIPDTVTSPVEDGKSQPFYGNCFCIPRSIYEKVGGLDERYRISYYDDADYYNTLKANNVEIKCIESVEFSNPHGGTTLHTFPDHEAFFEENKNRFIAKWGRLPDF